jgi:hypothetical protein
MRLTCKLNAHAAFDSRNAHHLPHAAPLLDLIRKALDALVEPPPVQGPSQRNRYDDHIGMSFGLITSKLIIDYLQQEIDLGMARNCSIFGGPFHR